MTRQVKITAEQKTCKHTELVRMSIYQLYGNQAIIRQGHVEPGDESFSPIFEVYIECHDCGFSRTYKVDREKLPEWVKGYIRNIRTFMSEKSEVMRERGVDYAFQFLDQQS